MKQIQVLGAPTVDWMTFSPSPGPSASIGRFYAPLEPRDAGAGVHVSVQPGGSALLTRLLKRMTPGEKVKVEGPTIPREDLFDAIQVHRETDKDVLTRVWTTWESCEALGKGGSGPAGPEGDRGPYRFTGKPDVERSKRTYPREDARLISSPIDVLVIDDAVAPAKTAPSSELKRYTQYWRQTFDRINERLKHVHSARSPSIAIYKLSRTHVQDPGEQGSPPEWLLGEELKKLGQVIVVAPIRDLRDLGLNIPVSLSWESLLDHVSREVRKPGLFAEGEVLSFAAVVTVLGPSGAVIVERERETVVFDRTGQEGDFERQHPGHVLGYTQCVVASLATCESERETGLLDSLSKGAEPPGLIEAVRRGIVMARAIHRDGYQVVKGENTPRPHLQFPYERAAEAYHQESLAASLAKQEDGHLRIGLSAEVGVFFRPDGSRPASHGGWTILQELRGKPGTNSEGWLSRYARLLALSGPRTTENPYDCVPLQQIKHWCSVDRDEIEGMRAVTIAVREYLDRDKSPVEPPLSVAVFGQPGSGKTFAIEQLAKEAGMGIVTCNLSGFSVQSQLKELHAVLHRLRDPKMRAQGAVPFVLWDEFDSEKLQWLRHFLAPMQDGKFNDGGGDHYIGPAVFVFAGGTSASFDMFAKDAKRDMSPPPDEVKKPDFVSRLRAYMDVKGPNEIPGRDSSAGTMMRRALLLYSFLNKHAEHLWRLKEKSFEVQDEVLRKFLEVEAADAWIYKHGARSMEAIIKTSKLAGKRHYDLSCLPAGGPLEMHLLPPQERSPVGDSGGGS